MKPKSSITLATVRSNDDEEETVVSFGHQAGAKTGVELAGILGEGGMGVVRAGRQVSLGREVAVKLPRDSERHVRQLMREAWVTSALEHPNIVPVYDLAHEGERPLIVMKRVEGRGWDEIIFDDATPARRGEWLEAQLRTFVQVCHAVEFAHSRGIVHRDLKPANVMIGDYGEVYVLDWGLAVALTPDRAGRFPLAVDITTVSGTPAYMSPEQAYAEGARIDARTDVYLLGAILCELLTGLPPHLDDDVQKALQKAAAARPPRFDASVPEPLAAICRKALASDQSQRFQGVAELRGVIEDFLRHRVSIELTEKARARIGEMRRLTDGSADADTRTLHKTFSECQFALQQALDIWPDNRPARAALQEATELMIAGELDRGDLRYAELLLAELKEPNATLSARLEAQRRKAAQEQQKMSELARLGRQFDKRIGVRGRVLAAAAFGVVFFVRPVLLGILDRLGMYEITPQGELYASVPFFLLFGGLIWVVRDMLVHQLNRLALGLLAFVGLGAFALRLGAVLLGYPIYVPPLGVLLLEAMMLAAVGLASDKRLLVAAAFYLGGFSAILYEPTWWPFATGLSNLSALGLLLWTWRDGGDDPSELGKATGAAPPKATKAG